MTLRAAIRLAMNRFGLAGLPTGEAFSILLRNDMQRLIKGAGALVCAFTILTGTTDCAVTQHDPLPSAHLHMIELENAFWTNSVRSLRGGRARGRVKETEKERTRDIERDIERERTRE